MKLRHAAQVARIFWDLPFVAGVGAFVVAVVLADQAGIPLVVCAFNAGLWLAHWACSLHSARLVEALRLTREMCAHQAALIEALKREEKP